MVDDKNILVSRQLPIGHCLRQLIGASIEGQWLPISHPGDIGSRRTSGDTGQVRGYGSIGKSKMCDARWSWQREPHLIQTINWYVKHSHVSIVQLVHQASMSVQKCDSKYRV